VGQLVLILDNIRSAHNVGAIFRTAAGLGVNHIYCVGLTPYPAIANDRRLPHIANKASAKIAKTALGSQSAVDFSPVDLPARLVDDLTRSGFTIACLEITPGAVKLDDYQPPAKLALVLGNEVGGVDRFWLDRSSQTLAIPMRGQKQSLNVAAAAAIAVYSLLNR